MKRGYVFSVVSMAVMVLLGVVLWAQAGDVNPPPGPVAPTMKTLDQLSGEHAQLASAIAGVGGGGGGGVNRVVQGVVDFPSGSLDDVTKTFSPEIDPSKSVVVLSDAVIGSASGGTMNNLTPRNGSCLVALTSSSLTVGIDVGPPTAPRRVSYQIIEYK